MDDLERYSGDFYLSLLPVAFVLVRNTVLVAGKMF